MVDWLFVWGVTQAAGFVFKPILEDLAKESAKDYAKDFFKDCLKKVIHLPEKNAQKEAYGKALKEFLQFLQQELEDADYQDIQIKQYIRPLQKFVEQEDVAAALGQAFEPDCSGLDIQTLASTWKKLDSPLLPEEFSWERVSKRYLKRVKAIVRESEQLRPIFEAQAQAAMAEGMQEIAGITPEFDLSRYAEGLRERYGNLRLESLDISGVYYSELKLWKLFIPQNVRECQEFLPQVYEIPKDHGRRLREQGQLDETELAEAELEQHRKVYVEQPLLSVLQAVGDPTAAETRTSFAAFLQEIAPLQYVVVLGDPGSGKSTLLQYLALVWAERSLSELPLHPIPLLIELRTYARDKQAGKCKDILSFIHSGNITCRLNQQQLHDKLKAGHLTALFDGIDEVFDPALRDEVVTDIHRFTNEYSTVQVIVTSRWLGYKAQRLRDVGFRHFMLQDLEADQIELFIQRWHDLTFVEGTDKVRKQERLQKAIQDSKAIRELAGNPLLLTMMAILNRNQELPRDRPELYNQASRVLLHQWDVEAKLLEDPKLKDLRITVDYKDKQAMLRKVAYHMQSSNKGLAGNLISAADLENILTDHLRVIVEKGEPRMVARVMIDQLRTRNFILCFLGADSYAFVHRTFLEYFCAWEFVDQFEKQRTLDEDQLKQKTFGEHWQDETWHEVLRLIAGMIDPKFVAKIIDFLLEQKVDRSAFLEANRQKKEGLSNLLLAANCFAEVRNKTVIGANSTQLLQLLQRDIEREYPYQLNSETAIALITLVATIGQDRFTTLHWLKNCLRLHLSSFVPESAVHAIAQGWKDNPDTLPWLKTCAQTDKNPSVRRAAVQELARGWKDDPDTLPWLKTCAQTDKNPSVRRAAVQELARSWKDDPDTLPILKTAQTDENSSVRQAAVQELARGWKDDPDTLPWLKTCAQTDENPSVRRAAVQKLARSWKDDPDTLPILKTAQTDENSIVRQAAVQELARSWKDDPDTLPWLKTCAQTDEDFIVCQAAIQAIAQGWKDDPDTLPWLKTCAQISGMWALHFAAVQTIAQGWKDDPDTLPWLKTCAQISRIWPSKFAAVQALAQGWKDDPDTLPTLKTCAQTDEDADVRQAAVQELARGWKDDPDTLPWLKTCAQTDEDADVRQAAVQELARGWKDDPDTLPWLKTCAQTDEDADVRQAAVQELARGWKDDPDTLPILKTAQIDEDADVRQAAVQELARGWKDDPDTLPWLKTCAQTDKNPSVRRAAVQELARGWKDNPDTLPILKTAQTDENPSVRHAAVQELARGWKDDPDTLPWLKTAQADENPSVRRTAVQKLAQGWKDDPDTLSWLKTCAQTDEDADVRQAAVQELARGWKDNPDTLPLLKSLVQLNNAGFVRGVAADTIAKYYSDDSDSLSLLKSCVQSDENWEKRRERIHRIARQWKEDPETLCWLSACFSSDSDNDGFVRGSALEMIAENYKDHPSTLQLLTTSLYLDRDWQVRWASVEALARDWNELPDFLDLLLKCAISDPFNRQEDWEEPPRQAAIKQIVFYYPTSSRTKELLIDRANNDPDEQIREFAKQELVKLENQK